MVFRLEENFKDSVPKTQNGNKKPVIVDTIINSNNNNNDDDDNDSVINESDEGFVSKLDGLGSFGTKNNSPLANSEVSLIANGTDNNNDFDDERIDDNIDGGNDKNNNADDNNNNEDDDNRNGEETNDDEKDCNLNEGFVDCSFDADDFDDDDAALIDDNEDDDDNDDNDNDDEDYDFEDELDVEEGKTANEERESLIPDGGWGWIVCFGSFMVNFILDGTMFSFGILLSDLQIDLGGDKSTTSLGGAALLGFSMFAGPFVSYLLDCYSIRQVTIAGAFLSMIAFTISSFSTNTYMFIMTYGVLGGTGFSMIFLPAIIVVGVYFNKKRAIATGVAMSGSGLGTFTYAYLANNMLQEYRWRGAVLIIGGLVFNTAVCGMLFRPIVPKATSCELEKLKEQKRRRIVRKYSSRFDVVSRTCRSESINMSASSYTRLNLHSETDHISEEELTQYHPLSPGVNIVSSTDSGCFAEDDDVVSRDNTSTYHGKDDKQELDKTRSTADNHSFVASVNIDADSEDKDEKDIIREHVAETVYQILNDNETDSVPKIDNLSIKSGLSRNISIGGPSQISCVTVSDGLKTTNSKEDSGFDGSRFENKTLESCVPINNDEENNDDITNITNNNNNDNFNNQISTVSGSLFKEAILNRHAEVHGEAQLENACATVLQKNLPSVNGRDRNGNNATNNSYENPNNIELRIDHRDKNNNPNNLDFDNNNSANIVCIEDVESGEKLFHELPDSDDLLQKSLNILRSNSFSLSRANKKVETGNITRKDNQMISTQNVDDNGNCISNNNDNDSVDSNTNINSNNHRYHRHNHPQHTTFPLTPSSSLVSSITQTQPIIDNNNDNSNHHLRLSSFSSSDKINKNNKPTNHSKSNYTIYNETMDNQNISSKSKNRIRPKITVTSSSPQRLYQSAGHLDIPASASSSTLNSVLSKLTKNRKNNNHNSINNCTNYNNDNQNNNPHNHNRRTSVQQNSTIKSSNSNTSPFQNLAPFGFNRLLKSEYKLNDTSTLTNTNMLSQPSYNQPRAVSSGHFRSPLSGSRASSIHTQISKGLSRPLLRQDIYYGGSINHLCVSKQFGSMTSFVAAMTRASSGSIENGDAASSRFGDASSRIGRRKGICCKPKCSSLQLFKNLKFVLLLICFTMWTAQSISLTYIPELAISRGISQPDAAFLISIVGIANVLGRLMSGLVTDFLRVPSIWLYVGSLVIAAVVNFFIAFGDSYALLTSCAAIFGLCMGVAVSMRTIVLAEELGIENLTQAFGVVAMFQGVAFTINPPIAGKLIDNYGGYEPPFLMVSIMYAISGVSVIAVLLLNRFKRNNNGIVDFDLEIVAVDDDGDDDNDDDISRSCLQMDNDDDNQDY